jgi:hypothetical protein
MGPVMRLDLLVNRFITNGRWRMILPAIIPDLQASLLVFLLLLAPYLTLKASQALAKMWRAVLPGTTNTPKMAVQPMVLASEWAAATVFHKVLLYAFCALLRVHTLPLLLYYSQPCESDRYKSDAL